MEDCKKKYEEALERARQILNEGKAQCFDVMTKVFPELRENENDRIRQDIITTLSIGVSCKESALHPGAHTTLKEAIDWLEKQGQTFTKKDVDDAYLKGVCDTKQELEKQGERKKPNKNIVEIWKNMRLEVYQQASGNRHEPNCSDDTTKMFSLNNIDEIIEKVGEQTLVDNVKPKFKVGDWVVQDNIGTYKIVEVCDSWYEVIDNQNNRYSIGFDQEYMLHLWSIKDAKDGDVLYTSSTSSNEVFIFKGLTIEGYIECYCSYDSEDKYCKGKYHFIGKPTFNTHPATKEQRDLLFQKMKEAGYKWENNQLEKNDNIE